MKKFCILSIFITLTFAITGCGRKTVNPQAPDAASSEVSEKTDVTTPTSVPDKTESAAESSDTSGWREFLTEYKAWVDKYIAIVKKYKANPQDTSILSDYTSMMSELAQWQSKADNVQKELESASPSELAEYSAKLLKIAEKISKAAY